MTNEIRRLKLSAIIPNNNGIKNPPEIPITNIDEAWLVYFPRFVVANENIEANMMEIKKPVKAIE